MRIRYEIIMWSQHLLKFIPGKIGCFFRKHLLPFKSGSSSFVWDSVHIDSPSKLIIGNNVSINRGCILNAAGEISILDDVLIGPEVIIYSQNHIYKSLEIKINEQGYIKSSVLIKENVWIGARSIILPGVKIGCNSIIGAGSIVTKDVPPNCIFAGNPARLIKHR